MNISRIYAVVDIKVSHDIFLGWYEDYIIHPKLLDRLSKDLGISQEIYRVLYEIDKKLAQDLVGAMSSKKGIPKVVLLLDKQNGEVIDYSLDFDRLPTMNEDFINRSNMILESSSDIEVFESYIHSTDRVSQILVKKIKPISIEEKHIKGKSEYYDYYIGVAIFNDEVNTTWTRLVLYIEDFPVYLPASYYNATTSRYRRSTSSSEEALEVLLLKVIDDLREDALYDTIYNLHYRYQYNSRMRVSYEEFSSLLNTMRRIPSIIDNEDLLEDISYKIDLYERIYPELVDHKNSLIWRCTALGDYFLAELLHDTVPILKDLKAPSIEYTAIRELLGKYISTPRIVEEIAKEEKG